MRRGDVDWVSSPASREPLKNLFVSVRRPTPRSSSPVQHAKSHFGPRSSGQFAHPPSTRRHWLASHANPAPTTCPFCPCCPAPILLLSLSPPIFLSLSTIIFLCSLSWSRPSSAPFTALLIISLQTSQICGLLLAASSEQGT